MSAQTNIGNAMKSPVIVINRVLDSILKKDTLEELVEKGELPKLSFKRKSGDFSRIFFELVELCGQRVEKELDRRLHNAEIVLMAEKIEQFLKVSLVS